MLVKYTGFLYYSTRKLSQNTGKGNIMNVFDRHAKKLQRDRTAMNKDYQLFSYLKDEVNVFFLISAG